ncbi:MAG: XTP/dITP diphosphatase [Candidatus Thermoplasmatota archaeon]|nr:XTP/dITP diphosphatase [Candidatus Thermoplasmatota archaeon]
MTGIGSGRTLHIATTNVGKLREIERYLGPLDIKVKQLETSFIEVQADTLEEVVIYGMEKLMSEGLSDMMFMKDDSGLFIDALGGFPGVYSAYVNRTLSCRGLLRLMEDIKERRAVFRTVLGLNEPGKGLTLLSGECRGTISDREAGKNGFGFDPVFVPEGHDRTFAQMTTEEKNSLSHRIRAVDELIKHLSRA